jgi:hypothetical protein
MLTIISFPTVVAAGSDQDNHGCEPGRQLRRRYGSDLGPWRDPRLYVTPVSPLSLPDLFSPQLFLRYTLH